MIDSEKKNKLDAVANLISNFIELTYPGKNFEYYQLEQLINDLMDGTLRAVIFIVRIRPCLSICLKCLIRRSLSKMDRLDKTLQRIDKFNLDRDWNQFQ